MPNELHEVFPGKLAAGGEESQLEPLLSKVNDRQGMLGIRKIQVELLLRVRPPPGWLEA